MATGDSGRVPSSRNQLKAYRWPLWLPLATLITGVLITGVLAWVSHTQYANNEKRLLRLRVGDASALLTESVPSIQTPLASAVELADATDGNVQKFNQFIAPYVAAGPRHRFASVSLWRLGSPQHGPIAVYGAKPKLELSMSSAPVFLARAERTSTFDVIGLLQPPSLRLGYAYGIQGRPNGFVAYGEVPLPKNRRSRLQSSSQFAGLDYAVYLGSGERPQDLLVADLARPPLRGTTAAETVPFGNSALTLAMSSRAPLAGAFPRDLPWIIAVVGVLLSMGAAFGASRLIKRRRDAERLASTLEVTASENERLFAEQRSIAQTLQHALLPDTLPEIPGVQTSARYEAGEKSMEIGGDWYDVIDLGDGRILVVVGDVSGKGLRAATTMAALRFAIRAYAAQNDAPATILHKLCKFLNVRESGQLATILCARLDMEGREISVTSAGHLPPLLISNGHGQYLETAVGVPIGVEADAEYTTTTVPAPEAATLIAFTDGLVEHRGENLDQGLARLRDLASVNHAALPELLSKLVNDSTGAPTEDDIAIVGVRWTA